jgi:hypothetical protein
MELLLQWLKCVAPNSLGSWIISFSSVEVERTVVDILFQIVCRFAVSWFIIVIYLSLYIYRVFIFYSLGME